MRKNEIIFPSKKDAQSLRKNILDFFKKQPTSFCFSYEWVLGIVQPKSEADYIQVMYRFSTQGLVKRCDAYLKNSITHGNKEYILRLENYGDSKKTRMQAGVNPLAFSFGKIMLDYVFLFIVEKNEDAKKLMIECIDKQMKKERYFSALRNIEALENIFGVKVEVKKKQCEQQYLKQKQNLSSVQQSIKNMQINVANAASGLNTNKQATKQTEKSKKGGEEQIQSQPKKLQEETSKKQKNKQNKESLSELLKGKKGEVMESEEDEDDFEDVSEEDDENSGDDEDQEDHYNLEDDFDSDELDEEMNGDESEIDEEEDDDEEEDSMDEEEYNRQIKEQLEIIEQRKKAQKQQKEQKGNQQQVLNTNQSQNSKQSQNAKQGQNNKVLEKTKAISKDKQQNSNKNNNNKNNHNSKVNKHNSNQKNNHSNNNNHNKKNNKQNQIKRK